MAGSLPTPFWRETMGVAGLSSPAKGRSARSVSTALTNKNRTCDV